jgi:hypothetical protein
MKNIVEIVKILITSILLAVGYGIIHDLITINISLEYFTIGHPIIIENNSPIIIALVWGIIATWWAGLIIGILIATTASAGNQPKLGLKDVLKPMLSLILAMSIFAALSGLLGFILADNGLIFLNKTLSQNIPESKHNQFLIAGWSHGTSYLTGFIGTLIICFKMWHKRKKLILQ